MKVLRVYEDKTRKKGEENLYFTLSLAIDILSVWKYYNGNHQKSDKNS